MGYSPWSRKELDTTERLHFHFPFLLFTIHSVNESSKADQQSSTHGVKNGPFISFNTSRYVFVLREKYYFTVSACFCSWECLGRQERLANYSKWAKPAQHLFLYSWRAQNCSYFFKCGWRKQNFMTWKLYKFQFPCLHITFHWKTATYLCLSPIYHFFSGYSGHKSSCHRDLKDYKDENIYY